MWIERGSLDGGGRLMGSAAGLGGCAVLNNVLFVTSLNGEELLAASFSAKTGLKLDPFSEALKASYGRLTTVVGAASVAGAVVVRVAPEVRPLTL